MAEYFIPPGIGIYARADAARLLGVTPSRLRRWASGYTYRLRDARGGGNRRQMAAVIKTDHPVIDNTVALSFLELIELKIVKALVERGLSLQHVRAKGELARARFRTEHPFASHRVFTDGKAIFSAVSEGDAPDVVRWHPHHIDQIIAGPVLEQFLHEVDYESGGKQLAYRWWPLGRDYPVVLDPRISFGAPVIAGTAVRTSVIADLATHHSTERAAVAFEVQLEQAAAAVRFERELLAA